MEYNITILWAIWLVALIAITWTLSWRLSTQRKKIEELDSKLHHVQVRQAEEWEQIWNTFNTECVKKRNVVDVSMDIHFMRKNGSWAVLSCADDKERSFIKFIDLSHDDMRDISTFLRQFESQPDTRINIDANPFDRRDILRGRFL